jgi:hypothetical protein
MFFPHPMLPTSNRNSDSVLVCLVLCINGLLYRWPFHTLPGSPPFFPGLWPFMEARPVRDLSGHKNKKPH